MLRHGVPHGTLGAGVDEVEGQLVEKDQDALALQ